MFPRTLCFALLSIYLSALSAQAAPQGFSFNGNKFNKEKFCQGVGQSVVTVTQVVTQTAAAAAPTSGDAADGVNNGSNAGGNNGDNTNNGNTNNGNTSNGNTSNGNTSNGNTSNGNTSNGNTSNGNTSNGNTSNGNTSNGNTNNGNGANGGNNNGNGNGGNGGNGNGGNGNDAQTSLTLDASVIADGFASDGQNPPVDGQSPSLTSTNNFINFCVGQTITNGQQLKDGSCNPCPIGQIPSTNNMPSGKFVFPPNGDASIQSNTAFTIQLKVERMQLGSFTNAQKTYFAAPQQLNNGGQIIGHTHVVIEKMNGLGDTSAPDPNVFEFFKGVNIAANAQGVVTADVTDGLNAGIYRLSSINAASNHQPIIVPIAQHGFLDDAVYFEVSDNPTGQNLFTGGNASNNGNAGNNNGNAGNNNGNAGNNNGNTGNNNGNAGNNNGNTGNTGNNNGNTGNNTGNTGNNNGNTGNTGNNTGNTGNNNGAAGGIGDFGICSVPEVEFGVGFDGRKETSFRPVDLQNFNHGSAQGFNIIGTFICDQLVNRCKADQTAKDTCAAALTAAEAEAPKTGAQADAFNAAFGKTSNFAAVQAIDDQGRPVGTPAANSDNSNNNGNVNNNGNANGGNAAADAADKGVNGAATQTEAETATQTDAAAAAQTDVAAASQTDASQTDAAAGTQTDATAADANAQESQKPGKGNNKNDKNKNGRRATHSTFSKRRL